MRYAERPQALDAILQHRRLFGRVGARGPQDRAAGEVDAADVLDGERFHVLGVATGDPAVAVEQTDDVAAAVDRFDGRGRDDAVDARRRTAAYENAESAHAMSEPDDRRQPVCEGSGAGGLS